MPTTVRTFALVLLATIGHAQSLSVQGSNSQAFVPIGGTLELQIVGPPGLPFILAVSPDPGPIVLPGLVIPIGPTGLVDLAGLLPFDPSGSESRIFGIPNVPVLLGAQLFAVAGWLDPSAALGVVISNGVQFQFANQDANAGPDAIAFVNQEITLDGSLSLSGSTSVVFQWSVVGSPLGSNPALAHDQTAFPLFVTDEPGLYSLELLTFGPGGISADHVRVLVYRLDIFSPQEGSFLSAPVSVQGRLEGPPATLTIDGIMTPVQSGGFFSSVPVAPPTVSGAIRLEIQWGSGLSIARAIALFEGAADPLGSWTGISLATRENSSALSSLEAPIEQSLSQLPIGFALALIPTLPLPATSGAFGTIDPLTGAAQPGVDFQFVPSTLGIGMSATWTGVTIQAQVQGNAQGQPFASLLTVSSPSVQVTSELTVGSPPGAPLNFVVANGAATSQGWSLQATPSLPPSVSETAITNALEAAVGQELVSLSGLIAPAVSAALSGLALNRDLSSQGVPLQIEAPLALLTHDGLGLEARNNFRVTPLAFSPTAPLVSGVRRVVAALPNFPPAVPGVSGPYDAAHSQSLAVLNQVTAALTATGSFERDFGGVASQSNLTLTVGTLLSILPGLGLDTFDITTPVLVHAELGSSPVASAETTGARLHLAALRLTFAVETSPFVTLPLFTLSFDAIVPIQLEIDTNNRTQRLGYGIPQFGLVVERSFAGRNQSPPLAGLTGLLMSLIPTLLGPLEQVPLPLPDLSGAVALGAGAAPAPFEAQWAFFDLP